MSDNQKFPTGTVIRRVLFACSIFGLSFVIFRWAVIFSPVHPPIWYYIFFAELGAVLLVSSLEKSGWWGLLFGVSFAAGYIGLLPHPEVDLFDVFVVLFMGGLMFGGICAGFARLRKTRTKRAREQLEDKKAAILNEFKKYMQEGYKRTYDEDYESAVRYFDRVIDCYTRLAKLGSTDEVLRIGMAKVWHLKGNTLEKLGKHGEAAKCHMEALKIEPDLLKNELISMIDKALEEEKE